MVTTFSSYFASMIRNGGRKRGATKTVIVSAIDDVTVTSPASKKPSTSNGTEAVSFLYISNLC